MFNLIIAILGTVAILHLQSLGSIHYWPDYLNEYSDSINDVKKQQNVFIQTKIFNQY